MIVEPQTLSYTFGNKSTAKITFEVTDVPEPPARMYVGNTTRGNGDAAGVAVEDAEVGVGRAIRLFDKTALTARLASCVGRFVTKSFKVLDADGTDHWDDFDVLLFKHEIDAKALNGEDIPTWRKNMGSLVKGGAKNLGVGVTAYGFEIGRDFTPYLVDGAPNLVVDCDGQSPKSTDMKGTYHDYRRAIDAAVAYRDKYGLILHCGELSADYAAEDTDGMMRVKWYRDTLDYLEQAGFVSACVWYYGGQPRSVPRPGAETAAVSLAIR